MSKPARLAVLGALLLATAPPAVGQQGRGDGFLFRRPDGTLTIHGGYVAPVARSDVFTLATDELTLGRGDFGSGFFGVDLAFRLRERWDLVIGFERSTRLLPSEYRDFVEEINGTDYPIEQTTRFQRTPFMASGRYYLRDRGRTIGSVAWIPSDLVPYVSAGAGVVGYMFEQRGDFVDSHTLGIFSDRLLSRGWAGALQLGGGAQWTLSPRTALTGELRYIAASGDGDAPRGDFSRMTVDLSSLSTVIGLTLRF